MSLPSSSFKDYTVLHLKQIAKDHKIAGCSQMTRSQLLSVLTRNNIRPPAVFSRTSTTNTTSTLTPTNIYHVNGQQMTEAEVLTTAKEQGVRHYQNYTTENLVSVLNRMYDEEQMMTEEEKTTAINYKRRRLEIALRHDLSTALDNVKRFDRLLLDLDEYEIVVFSPTKQLLITELREKTEIVINEMEHMRKLQQDLQE